MAGALLGAALLLAIPALADDKADCSAGITMIQAEIAKAPAEPALAKLKKALKNAQREQKEGEFDECMDAVGDAKRALK
ncbi:hypothetical protein [Methylobacterium brachythecii]|uniref:Histidine kinase n=1 Tax=Methylobacterium brachythecii TaxID=1176177 RepID=A0A7W6AH66_9HYPH|nr:hypothetical protein [Methylobacterium brachythecii]MBB3902623.1 hypothetical protein [Methylobacterium brachythecii]GLS42467.1 hypothetical protein GCM10007884_04520 [Methylobacterium brachythecii]